MNDMILTIFSLFRKPKPTDKQWIRFIESHAEFIHAYEIGKQQIFCERKNAVMEQDALEIWQLKKERR